MGFFRIGKEREALGQRGESYRLVVAKYLESKGLRVDSESPVEGSFEDMICYESETWKVCVECKATKMSIHSSKFLGPLCVYLTRFVRLPRESRFRTLFFFEEVSSAHEFAQVFRDMNGGIIAALRGECTRLVRTIRTEHPERDLVDPSEVPEDLFLAFVDSVDVYEGDVADLEFALRQREPQAAARSSALQIAGLSAGAEALRLAAQTDQVAETLVSNLFEGVEISETIVGVPDDEKIPRRREPPKAVRDVGVEGIVRAGVRYFLSELPPTTRKVAILEPFVEKTSAWRRDPDKRWWLQGLLFQHFAAYCCGNRLFLGTSDHRLIFVPDGDKGLSVTWAPGGTQKKREVVQRRTGAGGRILFAHHALDAGFVLLGERIFLEVNTSWEFTVDGRTFVDKRVGQPLRREYRRRERNRGRLVDLIFWSKYIARTERNIEIPVGRERIVITGEPVSYGADFGILADQYDLQKLLSTPSDYRFESLAAPPLESDVNPLEPWLDQREEEGEG